MKFNYNNIDVSDDYKTPSIFYDALRPLLTDTEKRTFDEETYYSVSIAALNVATRQYVARAVEMLRKAIHSGAPFDDATIKLYLAVQTLNDIMPFVPRQRYTAEAVNGKGYIYDSKFSYRVPCAVEKDFSTAARLAARYNAEEE